MDTPEINPREQEKESEDLGLAKRLAGQYFVDEMAECERQINNLGNTAIDKNKIKYEFWHFQYLGEQKFFDNVQRGNFFEEIEIEEDYTSSVYDFFLEALDAEKEFEKKKKIGEILEAIEKLKNK